MVTRRPASRRSLRRRVRQSAFRTLIALVDATYNPASDFEFQNDPTQVPAFTISLPVN